MTRAGVRGGAEGREARKGGEGSAEGAEGRGLMAAERSASRGRGRGDGVDTRAAVQLHSVVPVSLPARLTDAVVERCVDGGS